MECNIKVGIMVVIFCGVIQVVCNSVWKNSDYTENKSVVTTTQVGQRGLVLSRGEGWTEAGRQHVLDVTQKHIFTFDFNPKAVSSVRLESEGKLVGGKALLKIIEKSAQSASSAEVEICGDSKSVMQQRHNYPRVSVLFLEYVPEGVTSGNLMINVWHRAD